MTVTPKPTSEILSRLESRTVKETKISDYEMVFFIALEKQMKLEGLSIDTFTAERMGSASIRLNCYAGIIGTVHLRKRIGNIQYFLSVYDSHCMNDAPVEAIISVIPYWIKYAKKCIGIHEKILDPNYDPFKLLNI